MLGSIRIRVCAAAGKDDCRNMASKNTASANVGQHSTWPPRPEAISASPWEGLYDSSGPEIPAHS